MLAGIYKWDPIGVLDDPDVQKDEYDSYAPEIIRLLDAEVDIEYLTNYLKNIVEENMRIPYNVKYTRKIAMELVEFWKK